MVFRTVVLAAALIAAAACSSNSSPSSPSAGSGSTSSSSTGATASIVLNAAGLTTTSYSPNPIVIKAGDSVTWKNNDSIAHTSTSNTSVWSSGTIAPGASFTATFSAAGTFPYHCAFHPGMVGTVTVQ